MEHLHLIDLNLYQNELKYAVIGRLVGAPSNAVTGQIYFDLTQHKPYYYDGASWNAMAGTGGGGSSAFASLTSGTNTTAAMVIGTGASLDFSGSGSINANEFNGSTVIALADGGLGVSLSDPGADRILFWDDSAGQVTWLSPGNSVTITSTTLDTSQDLRTSASPTFAGITIDSLSGILKATTGVVSGGATTSDLTEGSNLYYTDERVDDRVSALLVAGSGISLTYDDTGNTLTISSSGNSPQTIVLSGAVSGQGTGAITTTLIASSVDTSAIQNSAVSNAKLANMANGTIKGRSTAGTGVPEDLTTLPTAAFPGLTGDIHALAGSLSTTIQPNVITTSKIASGAVTGTKLETLVTSGTVGSSTAIPVITYDVYGRITSTTTATPGTGLISNIVYYNTGSGTYTPPAGVVGLIVEIVGGGGGSGGSAQGLSNCGASGSGGGGAYAFKRYVAPLASGYAYSVGTGGASGAAGNNNGSAGNQTTFESMTASGGLGGAGMASGSIALFALGGAGGTATGGDLNLDGGPGGHGIRLSGTIGASQKGGSTMFGDGPNGVTSTAAGKPGVNPGTGASGSFSTAADKAGANGKDGLVKITEMR